MATITQTKSPEQELIDAREQLELLQKAKGGTATVKKKRAQEIKRLEKEIDKLTVANAIAIGDYVCKKNEPTLPGIVQNINEKESSLELLILWENNPIVEPCDHSVLEKKDDVLFLWKWKDNQFVRDFDGHLCNDLGAIDDEREINQKPEQLSFLRERWNDLVRLTFPEGEMVEYLNQNYIVMSYHLDDDDYLQCFIRLPEDSEEKAVNPLKLKLLCLSQQVFNFKAIQNYPCTLEIPIAAITVDERLQGRVKYDEDAIADYAENIDELPPVKICLDNSGIYWLYDGFHTIISSSRAKRTTVKATVELGEYNEAFDRCLSVNGKRGVRLTTADKRKLVTNALKAREAGNLIDKETQQPVSNRWISRKIGVAPQTVNNIADELSGKADKKKKKKKQTKQLELVSEQETVTTEAEGETATKEDLTAKDAQALEDSEPLQREITDNDNLATLEIEQADLEPPVAVNLATQKAPIQYQEEEVIYIRNDATDKRLINKGREYATVVENFETSVTIRLWGGQTIEEVAKTQINKTDASIRLIVTVPKERLSLLMAKYPSIDEAIFALTETLIE